MKAAPTSATRTPEHGKMDQGRRCPAAASTMTGYIGALATSINSSPRVQTQLKLAEQIQNSGIVQQQLRLAAEINGDLRETVPGQIQEDEFPVQREARHEGPSTPTGTDISPEAAQLEASPSPNRTGLPDQLKSGVENLSGLSLDDVKVHYNSAQPAQLNALAYAQGSDIHLSPGQEKHLPHEAWHIVQQKQGRVRPTMQMKSGVPVNDDAGLEHEADVMGATALRAKRHRAGQLAASDESDPVIQAKVGFEFESVGNKWLFQGLNDKGKWKGIDNTKEILLYTSEKGGLGADNKYVEAITKPLSNWEEIEETIIALTHFLAQAQKGTYSVSREKNLIAKSNTGLNEHRIVPAGPFLAKPQATLGVQAVNIESLFSKLIGMNNSGKAPAGRLRSSSRATPNQPITFEKEIANVVLVQGMSEAVRDAKEIIEAIEIPEDQNYAEGATGYNEIVGFLAIIIKTLTDAAANVHTSLNPLTDPKYAFPLMHRTDFISMLSTLSATSQEILQTTWSKTSGKPKLQEALAKKGWLQGNVFTKGYLDEKKAKTKGPSRKEWINSIFNPTKKDKGKDKLSPPAGYPAHEDTVRPEGLGAYSADGKLLLFELRNIETDRPLELDQWIDLAKAIAILVATVENDKGLAPAGTFQPAEPVSLAAASSAEPLPDINNNNFTTASEPSQQAPPSLQPEIKKVQSAAEKKLSLAKSKAGSEKQKLSSEESESDPEEKTPPKRPTTRGKKKKGKGKKKKDKKKTTGETAPTRVQPDRKAKYKSKDN